MQAAIDRKNENMQIRLFSERTQKKTSNIKIINIFSLSRELLCFKRIIFFSWCFP